MLSLDRLIGSLPAQPDVRTLLRGFVPPPRFADQRFDNFQPDSRYPSQAAALERLRAVAECLHRDASSGVMGRLRAALSQRSRGSGTYLDGGFGVGKTHLLAALWYAVPPPKAFLVFDELVYTIGLLGVSDAREAFRQFRLVAVDEWELDDPGNLKLALAFLRRALDEGTRIAVTSNTLPDELGRGRFSQKDFSSEIEELAGAFDVVRIEGEDFRQRHFQGDPGREYFVDAQALARKAAAAGSGALLVPFGALLAALGEIHPIRYEALVSKVSGLFIAGLAPIPQLPDALRWVHFVDKLYDDAVLLAASGEAPLGELFPAAFQKGPYGKKFGRCLSRMEELLGSARLVRATEG